jgi:MFS family permease
MLIPFLVILIDMIGFGIMVPIFAFYALNLGASPALATLLMGLYVVAMIFTTPLLGRLSDYYGRKPVLMLSMVGATIGYLILANASNLWMIALARLISGAMAGNIAAAQAYMVDISDEKNRARAMGSISAAFGMGFLIGPMLGGLLAGDSFADANLVLPAYVSAGLSSMAFLAIVFFLPESLGREHRDKLRAQPRVSRLLEFRAVLSRPLLKKIIITAVLFNLGAGLFQTLFPIWSSDVGTNIVALQAGVIPFFGTGPKGLVPFLFIGGITLTITQLKLVGPMTDRFGEHQLLKFGALAYGASLLGLTYAAWAQSLWLLYFFMMTVSCSGAFATTSMQSLASKRAASTERGMVMGVFNAYCSMGNGIGIVLTGSAFTYISINASHYIGAMLMLAVAAMAVVVKRYWYDEYTPPPQRPG